MSTLTIGRRIVCDVKPESAEDERAWRLRGIVNST
jgi:hypothetical protein